MPAEVDMGFVVASPLGLKYLAGLVTKDEAMAAEAHVTGATLAHVKKKYAAVAPPDLGASPTT
jgi:hypothetical protein